MGIITEKMKEPEKAFIHFNDFIHLLSVFSDDTEENIALYLLKSEQFLKLDFYYVCYDQISNSFTYNSYIQDEPSSLPTNDFLRDISEGKTPFNNTVRECEPWDKAWLIDDILKIKEVIDIGLTIDDFNFYSKTNSIDIKHEFSKRKFLEELNRDNTSTYLTPQSDHTSLNTLDNSSKTKVTKRSRKEEGYLVTIALLLELLTKPKGMNNKPPFQSQATIIDEILNEEIYGQSKTSLEARFSEANKQLNDIRKDS